MNGKMEGRWVGQMNEKEQIGIDERGKGMDV